MSRLDKLPPLKPKVCVHDQHIRLVKREPHAWHWLCLTCNKVIEMETKNG